MAEVFFSIGVVTYKRPDFLKQCLESISKQQYPNFEVIIGNDDPTQEIDLKELGITDSRFKIFNHKKNKGEMENLNFVLSQAKGEYFTWLGDDDMFTDSILDQVYHQIQFHQNPDVIYYNFQFKKTLEIPNPQIEQKDIQKHSSQSFLTHYLERKLPLQGTYGIFKTKKFQQLGIKQLGSGFSPGSDTLVALETGLIGDIIYLKTPLVLFRAHEDSLSFSSQDISAYQSAFEDLLTHFTRCLSLSNTIDNKSYLLSLLLKWCTQDFFDVIRRSKAFSLTIILKYLEIYFFTLAQLSLKRMVISFYHLFHIIFYQLKVATKMKVKSLFFN